MVLADRLPLALHLQRRHADPRSSRSSLREPYASMVLSARTAVPDSLPEGELINLGLRYRVRDQVRYRPMRALPHPRY
eukprot:2530761-Rhodomonas_salina.1